MIAIRRNEKGKDGAGLASSRSQFQIFRHTDQKKLRVRLGSETNQCNTKNIKVLKCTYRQKKHGNYLNAASF